MRQEYDITNLNPRKNPYSNRVKKQITINLDGDVIAYFKTQSERSGIPYQTLINLYLSDCVTSKRELKISIWQKTPQPTNPLVSWGVYLSFIFFPPHQF